MSWYSEVSPLAEYLAGNASEITSGVLSITSWGPTSLVLAFTAGSNGALTVTAQVQRSVNGGATWTDEAGKTTSPATISNPPAGALYRVKFDDGVSASVYSNVISVPTYRGLHRWLSWLPAFP